MISPRLVIATCVVASLLCLFSRPTARADAAADARKEIEAVYARRRDAYDRRDPAGYLATFAPDYQSVNRAGRVGTLAQFRQNITKTMSSPARGRYNYVVKVQSLKLTGNQAVVVVKEHEDTEGRYPKTNAVYKSTTDEVLETVWNKEASGWLESHVRVLSYRQVREE